MPRALNFSSFTAERFYAYNLLRRLTGVYRTKKLRTHEEKLKKWSRNWFICRLLNCKQAVRGAATICPRPSLLSVGAEAPRAAEPTAPDRNEPVPTVNRPTFPRSPLQLPNAKTPRWVKRPGDFDLWHWKWCPSHVWRRLATSVPILVLLCLCSRLRPDVRDRPTDVRQHHR